MNQAPSFLFQAGNWYTRRKKETIARSAPIKNQNKQKSIINIIFVKKVNHQHNIIVKKKVKVKIAKSTTLTASINQALKQVYSVHQSNKLQT